MGVASSSNAEAEGPIKIDTSGMGFFKIHSMFLTYFSEILNIKPIKGTHGLDHVIGKYLVEWVLSYLKGDELNQDICKQILFTLNSELEGVRSSNPMLFESLVDKLKKVDQYKEGFRFELFIANALLKNRIKFIYGVGDQEIDFAISQSPKMGLECARIFLPQDKILDTEDLLSRVIRKIYKKNKKVYASSGSALILDISTIICRNYKNSDICLESICARINDETMVSKFGSVILMYAAYKVSEKKLQYCYQRIDSPHILQDLKNILDGFLVLGDFEIDPNNEIFIDLF